MPWFVYLARCADGTLYTGVTTDLAARERAHNAGRGAAYTSPRLPVRVVHAEPAQGRGPALRRELAIKRLTRKEKEALVTGGAAPGGFRGFGPGALRFLRSLARNNRREWFEARRAIYETEVREPMRALVEEMDIRLARLAPELTGDPRRWPNEFGNAGFVRVASSLPLRAFDYGIAANRTMLETVIELCYTQGLTADKPSVESLFAPGTA